MKFAAYFLYEDWKFPADKLFEGLFSNYIFAGLIKSGITMETSSRINPSEAKNLLEKNQEVKIIDVRTKEEYDLQHIPGAEHIAMEDILTSGIPYSKETPVLITCNHGLKKSEASAQSLNERGYPNVYILDGGIKAWFSQEK